MEYADVRIGQKVTWGSGRPRGYVVLVDPRKFGGECVWVSLAEVQEGNCGARFPVGTKGWFRPEDLTLVQAAEA